MLNILWGGTESNQIGTDEFLNFCSQTRAEPLLNINFESDGRKPWARPVPGMNRSAGPTEAAEWVDYCNNPDNALRRRFRTKPGSKVRWWQIGNETSYDKNGFDCRTSVRKTVEFAKAMRKADPDIHIIAWGDSGWAREMMDGAGEHISSLAFHHMFDPCRGMKNSPLRDNEFRKDPDRTWESLMGAWKDHDRRLIEVREQVSGCDVPLAMTECHFALPGRNRCEVLSSWAAGVANARLLNVNERHGDVLQIATLADFCGTRWQVNAIMIPTPSGRSFLMPVARVMSLFRNHQGRSALKVSSTGYLDVTASRTGNKLFLHVVNYHSTRSQRTQIRVNGASICSGKVFEISAPAEVEIMDTCTDLFKPVEHKLLDVAAWTFPARSVSAVELDLGNARPE
jgi:alpha-L-arabinofuranosidase